MDFIIEDGILKNVRSYLKSELIIPDGVRIIEDGAFYDCSNLKSIIIPDSVVEIGRRAFYGCNSLGDVIIPSSVKLIGAEAFNGCPNVCVFINKYTDYFINIVNRISRIKYNDYHDLFLVSDNIKNVIQNESINLLNCKNEDEIKNILLKFELVFKKTRENFISYDVYSKLNMQLASDFNLKVYNRFINNELFRINQNMKSALIEIIAVFGLFNNDKNVTKRIDYVTNLIDYHTYNYKISAGSFDNIRCNYDIKDYFERKIEKQYRLKESEEIPGSMQNMLKYFVKPEDVERIKKLPEGYYKSQLLKAIQELYDVVDIVVYDKKDNLSDKEFKELYKIMVNSLVSGHLNYDSIHRIFDGIELSYDKEKCDFLMHNLNEVIMYEDIQSSVREILRNYYKIKKQYSSSEKLSLGQCMDFLKENKFFYQEGFENIAKEATLAGVATQNAYDYYQELSKKMMARKKSVLFRSPKTRYNIDGNIFECELLKSDDPFALFVGEKNYTDCCQRYDLTGHNCMVHSVTSLDGGVFVVYLVLQDGSKKLLTQSWVWQNEQVYCYDNVEATMYLKSNSFLKDAVREVYKKYSDFIVLKSEKDLIEYAKEKENEINNLIISKEEKKELELKLSEILQRQTVKQVIAGSGCDDLDLGKSFKLLSNKTRGPKDYGNNQLYDMINHGAYRDSEVAYLLSGTQDVLEEDLLYNQEAVFKDEMHR